MKTAISDILKTDEQKANELLKIIESISKNGFKYQTENKKLSIWNKNRTLRASVIYKIDENGQNAFVKLLIKTELKF